MRKDVQALSKALPKKVRIGPHDWDILLMNEFAPGEKEGEQLWGYCEPRKNVICLANLNGQPSASSLVSVFLHELIHAIWYIRALPTKSKVHEEDHVLALEHGFTQLYRDNLWLLDWIKKGLK